MLNHIKSEKEYQAAMKTIETLLEKATKLGGFHLLSREESDILKKLSKLAGSYEDNAMRLMPLKA